MYTTDDAGEVSIAVLTVVEEADHSLGQLLMVVGVRDEVFLGAIDTFQQNKEQAGRRRRISKMTSSMRLASAFLLLGASSISLVCSTMRTSSVMRSLKRKII